ncbi:MAG TPA: VOC family protein, partial [Chitinophagaceae bacterium]|nr:VOC family protein [Chitinophagaceae bacterium]
MRDHLLQEYIIDHVEIYTPMAKALAYWHTQGLGFTTIAVANTESGRPGISSYMLSSGNIRLVLTSTYPTMHTAGDHEIGSYISRNYCGVKRFALRVPSVKNAFEESVAAGAIPVRYPITLEDASGKVEEAAIKLYDN